jgi:hypothetical protein
MARHHSHITSPSLGNTSTALFCIDAQSFQRKPLKERRSVAQLVEIMIEEAFQARGYLPKRN